jgi:ribosomal protein L11
MTAAVFAIAKQQRVWGRSQAAAFVGTLKEVLGSCHSLGVTVDGAHSSTLR